MMTTPHIVLAGEGGHVHLLASMALADALVQYMPEATITFVGSGRPMDRYSVRERGYGYIAIPSQPPPQGPLEAVRFVAENFIGYWASRWILREQQVSLAISFGGFTGGVVAKAAINRGLPTILLEENAVPERITRWLAGSASGICTSFKGVNGLLPGHAQIHLTGFPVSKGLEGLAEVTPAVCRAHVGRPRRLLVLGGSAGAIALNRAVPAALGRLRSQLEAWQIVHQTGPGELQAVEERYRETGVDALAVSFIDELAHVLGETDLVVWRGGGATLAEMAVAGVPTLVLPHPDAPDDQQLANAQAYAAAGACHFLDERECDDRFEEKLAASIENLISNEPLRVELASTIRQHAYPRAAWDIASLCAEHLSVHPISAAA